MTLGRSCSARRPHHRRWSGRVPAAQEQRAEMGEHRYRAGDRLRHRPLCLQGQGGCFRLQWAIGLELFLLSQDPWRVVLSTDHPNGGSFLSYPALIQLLMDRSVRDERLRQVNPKLLAGVRSGRWSDAGVHAQRDRHHHPSRARPGSSASSTRDTLGQARMPT